MKRAIIDYLKDEAGDWAAVLDCAHHQHLRHRPPFTNRPWVTSEQGRKAKLGEQLDCVRCDRMEWPDGVCAYKRTPDFDHNSVPRGLLADHRTASGVWGRIVVEHGCLHYHIDAMDFHQPLDTSTSGVVVPGMTHRVQVDGPVRFHVQFYRRPTPAPQ